MTNFVRFKKHIINLTNARISEYVNYMEGFYVSNNPVNNNDVEMKRDILRDNIITNMIGSFDAIASTLRKLDNNLQTQSAKNNIASETFGGIIK